MLKESANWIPKRCESVHFILCQIYFWYINGKFGDCCYVPLKRHNEIHFHAHTHARRHIFTPKKESLASVLCSSWSLAVACHHLNHFHLVIFYVFFRILLVVHCMHRTVSTNCAHCLSAKFFACNSVGCQMAKLKFEMETLLECTWCVCDMF